MKKEQHIAVIIHEGFWSDTRHDWHYGCWENERRETKHHYLEVARKVLKELGNERDELKAKIVWYDEFYPKFYCGRTCMKRLALK